MSSGRTIREWQKEVYGIARKHGFHENETPETVPIAEKLCLIHSEVSEALEEARQPDFKEPNSRLVTEPGRLTWLQEYAKNYIDEVTAPRIAAIVDRTIAKATADLQARILGRAAT